MKLSLKLECLLLFCLAALTGWADAIQGSTTDPASGRPEHRYILANSQGYYVNKNLAPTSTPANRAVFAMYAVEGKADAYYLNNVTAGKWVSYTKAATYNNQTGFLQLSAEKPEGAYFRFDNYAGEYYQIQPYTTGDTNEKYLNWFKGIGSDNPLDGNVSLGLWQDNGAKDAGSRWLFTAVDVEHTWTLFSAGMPSNAVIKVGDTEYRGVNAQGDTHFRAAYVDASEVSVTCGGGYVYTLVVDNANHQINVDFVQLFNPTASPTAEEKYPYLLKMPAAYVGANGGNLLGVTKKSAADRFLLIEDTARLGQYYIYDQTSATWISYSSATIGSTAKQQSESKVTVETSKASAKTWQLRLRRDGASVSILPGEISDPSGASAAWNFTGGVSQNVVLNLWRADDGNSAWLIEDPSVGSLACATTLFSEPGKEFMHKIVPNEGETVVGVDFGGLTSLKLYDDRLSVGNAYKYVYGKAPEAEGEYSYVVKLKTADGDESSVAVHLTVSNHLQSATPMMGWLTWNWFARAISHDKILAVVEGMQNKGLIDAGYSTIVLDDCWAKPESDKSKLTYDPAKFPSGISGFKAACQAVNPKVKIGIYSDAGSMTCERYQPGSYGFEKEHLALFDSWGVDMLKYDFCNSESAAFTSYKAMGAAVKRLNESRVGRTPFVFNICEWGSNKPWTWGAEAGGSSWRATSDVRESWVGSFGLPGVLGATDVVRNLWMYAGVNRFNDLDMMCIGLHGLGGPSNYTVGHQQNGGVITGLTAEQARSQMSLWCMFASPLSLSCDFRNTPTAESNGSAGTLPKPLITADDLATLKNPAIIAINQDALGQQAEYMKTLSTGTTNFSKTGYDVYLKDLTEGRKAVAVVNRGGSGVTPSALPLSALYMNATATYMSKDVWSGAEKEITGVLSVGQLKPYETKVFVLTEKNATTGVGKTALTSSNATPIYDLSGRQLRSVERGQLYIQGGDKLMK